MIEAYSGKSMPHIEYLSICGFKSIRKLENFELRPLNVLIGANGAGKSNLLDFFKMISAISQKRLQLFIKNKGNSDTLLFGGRKQTLSIDVALSFENNQYRYEFSLEPTANSIGFSGEKLSTVSGTSEWPGGGSESCMIDSFPDASHAHQEEFATCILSDIENWRVFHFQDMSDTARVRNQSEVRDNLRLRPDAGNLAPFLRRLREYYPNHYQRIIDLVHLDNPSFQDFVYHKNLNQDDIMELEWYEELGTSRMVFGPRQFSGGMLRFICLATLLNQPEKLQPSLILIDEPELGLHPASLTVLAEIIKQAAELKQVIISTQSAELISHFEPEDVVVVEQKDDESAFKRLDSEHIRHWLKDYDLGDLWNMNVFGGRP